MSQESPKIESSRVLSHISNPLIPIDLTKPLAGQVVPLHNRWHPNIPQRLR